MLIQQKCTRRGALQLVAFCVLPLLVPVAAQADTVEGTVRDSQGVPIQNVRVIGLTKMTSRAVTDRDGSFSLPFAGRAILFEHPDYAPKFVATGPKKSVLDVHLSTRAPLESRVPACKNRQLLDRNPFRRLKYRLQKGLTSVKSTDIDYTVVSVSWKKDKASYLRIWESVMSGGIPGDLFFDDVKGDILTIPIDLDGSKGYDIRVIKLTGKMSRRFGVFYTFLVYENVSPETATKFDLLISSLCYY